MNLLNSNLTKYELEAEAYQRGDMERVALLSLSIDGEADEISRLECELEDAQGERDDAEKSIERLKQDVALAMNEIEDAINAGNKGAALDVIANIREEL